MARPPVTITLPSQSLGTSRALSVYRFGSEGARPKVYVQGGLHADEAAGPLTAHHLTVLLEEAEARGDVIGDITVVPVANPVGLSQTLLTDHFGRYDLASGRNYNRAFPDVSKAVLEAVEGRLRDDADANRAMVAEEIKTALADLDKVGDADALQNTLLSLACDADIVLDLHTDSEAEMHLYLDPEHWPGASDLAGELDAAVVMFAKASGGNPFEETAAAPWHAVRGRHGAKAVPLPLTTVIELRGYTDAFDELAAKDAAALYRFLQRRGAVAGDAGPPPNLTCVAAPFEATGIVASPVAGVVAFKRDLGDEVSEGDLIAEIVDVSSNDGETCRTPIYANTSGRLFTRCLIKIVRPGTTLAKIQGTEPIPSRTGYLLPD